MRYKKDDDNRYRVNFMTATEELMDAFTVKQFISYLKENAEFEDDDAMYLDGHVVNTKIYMLHETKNLTKEFIITEDGRLFYWLSVIQKIELVNEEHKMEVEQEEKIMKTLISENIMNNYNGFYKVNEDNGGVCVGTFYNPKTKESFTKITWDIEDVRLEDDDYIQTLRYLPLNKDAKKEWLHNKGIIQEGDKVEVVKGRKVPHGTKAIVTTIKPYYDCYHRWQCDYAYLDNGMKTNINNCKMI